MKDRVFRDPVHGLIEFRGSDRPIADLLDTRAFQRLRRIHQMGFAWQVYPGAEHSRFGHALGTYHIASRVARELGLADDIARHVKIAALVHDIGHGPFSHSWEQAFDADPAGDHEAWGARIVREDAELSGALEALEGGLPDILCSFWDKTYAPMFARKLVSSQLDVDRLDYLLRDGHYSGAGYATYDLDWILHALQIATVRAGADPSDLVVDYRRGMFAVEQYLFARSYMYAQVYHHKTVRATEWMFLKLLRRFSELANGGMEPPGLPEGATLARGEPLSVEGYLRLDDILVTAAIDGWCSHAEDGVLLDLGTRLVQRRLFKTLDLGDDPAVTDHVAEQVREVAVERFGDAADYYFHLDTSERLGYSAAHSEQLFVVGHPRHGTVSLGQLLAELPLGRPLSRVRLVCAPELMDRVRPIAAAALVS